MICTSATRKVWIAQNALHKDRGGKYFVTIACAYEFVPFKLVCPSPENKSRTLRNDPEFPVDDSKQNRVQRLSRVSGPLRRRRRRRPETVSASRALFRNNANRNSFFSLNLFSSRPRLRRNLASHV